MKELSTFVFALRDALPDGWSVLEEDGIALLRPLERPGTLACRVQRLCWWCPGCDASGQGTSEWTICHKCNLKIENTYITRDVEFREQWLVSNSRAAIREVFDALCRGGEVSGGKVTEYKHVVRRFE